VEPVFDKVIIDIEEMIDHGQAPISGDRQYERKDIVRKRSK